MVGWWAAIRMLALRAQANPPLVMPARGVGGCGALAAPILNSGHPVVKKQQFHVPYVAEFVPWCGHHLIC